MPTQNLASFRSDFNQPNQQSFTAQDFGFSTNTIWRTFEIYVKFGRVFSQRGQFFEINPSASGGGPPLGGEGFPSITIGHGHWTTSTFEIVTTSNTSGYVIDTVRVEDPLGGNWEARNTHADPTWYHVVFDWGGTAGSQTLYFGRVGGVDPSGTFPGDYNSYTVTTAPGLPRFLDLGAQTLVRIARHDGYSIGFAGNVAEVRFHDDTVANIGTHINTYKDQFLTSAAPHWSGVLANWRLNESPTSGGTEFGSNITGIGSLNFPTDTSLIGDADYPFTAGATVFPEQTVEDNPFDCDFSFSNTENTAQQPNCTFDITADLPNRVVPNSPGCNFIILSTDEELLAQTVDTSFFIDSQVTDRGTLESNWAINFPEQVAQQPNADFHIELASQLAQQVNADFSLNVTELVAQQPNVSFSLNVSEVTAQLVTCDFAFTGQSSNLPVEDNPFPATFSIHREEVDEIDTKAVNFEILVVDSGRGELLSDWAMHFPEQSIPSTIPADFSFATTENTAQQPTATFNIAGQSQTITLDPIPATFVITSTELRLEDLERKIDLLFRHRS